MAGSFLPAFASATILLCATMPARHGLLPVLHDVLENPHCTLLVQLLLLAVCGKALKKPAITSVILLSEAFAWGKHIRDHGRMLSFSVA